MYARMYGEPNQSPFMKWVVILFVANLLFGGWSVDYCLWYYAGKNVPWWADVMCGLFAAEVTFPAAIVGMILNLAGLQPPLFG